MRRLLARLEVKLRAKRCVRCGDWMHHPTFGDIVHFHCSQGAIR